MKKMGSQAGMEALVNIAANTDDIDALDAISTRLENDAKVMIPQLEFALSQANDPRQKASIKKLLADWKFAGSMKQQLLKTT